MARVFKPTYPKSIPEGAKIITRNVDGKEKQFARFTDRRGKTVTAPLTEDGQRVLLETRKWYIEYRDGKGRVRRVPGFTDRKATEQKAADLERKATRQAAGIIDATDEQATRPLADHLAEFEAKMKAAHRKEKHVRTTVQYIKAITEAAGWYNAADIQESPVSQFVSDMKDKGRSARTVQAYLTAIKSFTRWLVQSDRLARDPLASIHKPNPKADRRRERRMLLPDEWPWLRDAALSGPERFGMSAAERMLLYGVGIQTGLRSSELRSLKRGQLFLDLDTPFITCKARSTKNSKNARQYITPDLAEELKAHVATKTPHTPIFPMPISEDVAEMLREDLAAARKEWLNNAKHDPEEYRRRMDQWEDSGKDYASWPALDVQARELAGMFPALGIGPGYRQEDSYQNIDYPGLLWEQLRDRDEKHKPKHHPQILRRAAELVASCPADDWRYSGPMTFSSQRFAGYLTRNGIPWPRLESDALALDEDTFREMARAYPAKIGPIRELRHALSQLKLNALAVGADGRNRCLLSAFGSKSGRNQPSNSKYIFGPSCWLRSLIRPGPGQAVAYIDWSQQELAIAAALSGDKPMMEAYRSGDFYLTFAKMAGAVPADATKKTHGEVRDQFKTVALGVLYGLSADGLARKLNVAPCRGRELLRMHQQVFRTFWAWSDRIEMEGMLSGKLQTVFAWRLHVGPDGNPRSLRNFPMQGNGAEMMRLACCLTTERGIAVCAVVHDALLVEGRDEEIETIVARTQEAMQEASELVLPDFPLRTDAKIVRHPDRYSDPRGEKMWQTVQAILKDLEPIAAALPPCTNSPVAEMLWDP